MPSFTNFHSIPSKLIFELAFMDPAIRTSLLSITTMPHFIYFVTVAFEVVVNPCTCMPLYQLLLICSRGFMPVRLRSQTFILLG